MLTGIVVGVIVGVVGSQMLGAWFARESAAVKAAVLAEVAKVAPDIEKIKSLIAKL